MIYLKLFYTFLKIGLFTIGGGYAMIPLINSEVIANGWMTQEMLIDFIAISESTPGAFAINVATFVGVSTGGFFGAVCTTLGLVTPSLIIIFLIAKYFNKLTEKPLVKSAFFGLRPAVIGLITYAFLSLALQIVFTNVGNLSEIKNTDWLAIILFAIMFFISKIKIPNKKSDKKTKLHPIFLIILAGILGMLVYGVIEPALL